jgi:pyrimidine deaminase RibD-like protein
MKVIFHILLFAVLLIFRQETLAFDDDDRYYMEMALDLASNALGKANPNPCVGCVIIDSKGEIVGKGWHARVGEAHAEVMALTQAGKRAAGGTAFVSLEPCNHFGRTPPCTHSLLEHGVKRVVAGMVDPDPRVSGTGIQYLRDQGIQVDVGLKEEQCIELNLPFVFKIKHQRPLSTVWTSMRPHGIVQSAVPLVPDVCCPSHISFHLFLKEIASNIDTICISADNLQTFPLASLPLNVNIAVMDFGKHHSLCKDVDAAISAISKASPGRRSYIILRQTDPKSSSDPTASNDSSNVKVVHLSSDNLHMAACLTSLMLEGSISVLHIPQSSSELEELIISDACQQMIFSAPYLSEAEDENVKYDPDTAATDLFVSEIDKFRALKGLAREGTTSANSEKITLKGRRVVKYTLWKHHM